MPIPLMIPRIIHQTYKTSDVPDRVKALCERGRRRTRLERSRLQRRRVLPSSWSGSSRSTTTRGVAAQGCGLSDFFRYLIVLHTGGVYADIDTECRQPMDSYLRSTDTLVVGWENEFRTDEMAYSRHFVRRRQVLNWVFTQARRGTRR